MLKLKLQYSGHLMGRTDSLEKSLMLGKTEGGRRREWQQMRWLDDITDWMDMSFSKLQELVTDREAWRATPPWGRKELDMTEQLNWAEEFVTNLKEVKNGFTQPVRNDRCIQSPFRTFQGRTYLPRVPVCPTDQQPGNLSIRRAEVPSGAEHPAGRSAGRCCRWHLPAIPQSLPSGWGQHTHCFISVQVTGTAATSLSGSLRNSQKLSLKEGAKVLHSWSKGPPYGRPQLPALAGPPSPWPSSEGSETGIHGKLGKLGKERKSLAHQPQPSATPPQTTKPEAGWVSEGKELPPRWKLDTT